MLYYIQINATRYTVSLLTTLSARINKQTQSKEQNEQKIENQTFTCFFSNADMILWIDCISTQCLWGKKRKTLFQCTSYSFKWN